MTGTDYFICAAGLAFGFCVWRFILALNKRKQELELEKLFKDANDIAVKTRARPLADLIRKANERFRSRNP